MPVLMVSSLTEKGCAVTLRALELGAVDFVTKPKIDIASGTVALADELVDKVKTAATARLRPRPMNQAVGKLPPAVARPAVSYRGTYKLLAIGASTGGTEAISDVLGALPADAPGVVVVVHMPAGFTHSYAERLNRTCRIRVREASDGDRVLPGHALIAPGNLQTELTRSGSSYAVRVRSGEAVNRHRPSVDVLFDSFARGAGPNAVGAILTGMGGDGAEGLLAMRRAGARTIAQDEASCVVFGMPARAIELGAAEVVLPLDQIARSLLQFAS
jgi:two-component system chemotaxis response regulator CheB